MRKLILLAALFVSTFTFAANVKEPEGQKPFFLLTVPKAGTGLINKLMRILTGKATCDAPNKKFKPQIFLADIQDITCYLNDHQYPFRHFIPFNHLYVEIHELYPEIQPILHIRDLRDVCIALAYSHKTSLDNKLGSDASIDDRLMNVILHPDELGLHDCKRNAECAVEWMNQPGVIITRFEELVGERGGGSDAIQTKAIKALANALNIQITTKQWEAIENDLFGGNKTFRKGQIGEWKEYFTEEHKIAFKTNLGTYLIKMGYEENDSW